MRLQIHTNTHRELQEGCLQGKLGRLKNWQRISKALIYANNRGREIHAGFKFTRSDFVPDETHRIASGMELE